MMPSMFREELRNFELLDRRLIIAVITQAFVVLEGSVVTSRGGDIEQFRWRFL